MMRLMTRRHSYLAVLSFWLVSRLSLIVSGVTHFPTGMFLRPFPYAMTSIVGRTLYSMALLAILAQLPLNFLPSSNVALSLRLCGAG